MKKDIQQLSACIGNRLLLQTGFSMCEKRNICSFTQIILCWRAQKLCSHTEKILFTKTINFQTKLKVAIYDNSCIQTFPALSQKKNYDTLCF